MDDPNILGDLLLFAGRDQLGESCPTYSETEIWESQNTFGKEYALHIRDIQAPPKKSCMQTCPPAWYQPCTIATQDATTTCQDNHVGTQHMRLGTPP